MGGQSGSQAEVKMDREQVSELLGRKVAVRLSTVEARSLEVIATLDEVREDGILLSEMGELGPGPTLHCPWDSLWRVRDRPAWLRPPHEESGLGEIDEPPEMFEMREVVPEEATDASPHAARRNPSARTLQRVVPIGQNATVGGITVALASLELHARGLGILRWLVALDRSSVVEGFDLEFGVPEPHFEIREKAGRPLSWSMGSSRSSDVEAEGGITVEGLPDSGEILVEVPRVVRDAYDPDGEYEGERPFRDGPWTFRFSI